MTVLSNSFRCCFFVENLISLFYQTQPKKQEGPASAPELQTSLFLSGINVVSTIQNCFFVINPSTLVRLQDPSTIDDPPATGAWISRPRTAYLHVIAPPPCCISLGIVRSHKLHPKTVDRIAALVFLYILISSHQASLLYLYSFKNIN